MQTLRMLGSIGLTRSDGTDVDALLRQPKSVALLAYLAMPRPGAWHRRDLLLATFWPELSQSHARAALRSALHLLRRHLESDTIRTRGDDEVAVAAERLTTDVAVTLDAVAAGARTQALASYGGALLPGLYVHGAPGFERWLETERARLTDLALKIAVALVEERERAGDLDAALDAARRAAELSPDDERVVLRWAALLGRIGDRAHALAVLEHFRARLASEFGAEPSAETMALADRLRTRTTSSDMPAASPIPPTDDAIASSFGGVMAREPPSATRVEPTGPAGARRRAGVVALVALLSAIAAGTTYISHRRSVSASAAAPADAKVRRVVLLPVQMMPTDTSHAYLASGLASGVARRLGQLGALRLRTGFSTEWPASPARNASPVTSLGPTVLLRIDVTAVGDSLDVRAASADSASRIVRAVLSRRFHVRDVAEIEGAIATAMAAQVHRVAAPVEPQRDLRALDPESYRLTMLGFHQLLATRDAEAALASLVRATQIDPRNARAWAGVSTAWAYRTMSDQLPFDEGHARATAAAERALAIDSTDGTALANLGVMRALERRDLSEGMPFLRRAVELEPSNAEIHHIESFLVRYAHQWDQSRDLIRLARELDPLTLAYAESEGTLEMCASRPAASEQVYRRILDQNPRSADAREGLVRAIAAQGRYDDALAVWRDARPLPMARLSPALSAPAARGRDGYFATWHAQGRARLAEFQRAPEGSRRSPLRHVDFQFQSGDTAAGFALLERAASDRAIWLFWAPCFAWLDEVRETPHYRGLLKRIGTLAAR